MNCTVCGKPHTKEQPLTVAHNDEWLCPGCLKELDIYSNPIGGMAGIIMNAADVPLYGKSPIEVAETYVKSRLTGKIKIGNVELPIESFEMR